MSLPTPARLFLHYLGQLKGLLHYVARHDTAILGHRVHPEMATLLQQASTAIGFTLRAGCPLAGRAIVSFNKDGDTLAGVVQALDATMAYLAAIPDADFAGMADLRIATTAGFAELELSGADYYLMYAVPNFFFHYTMVYATARQAGVPIGKADFDGFHAYPPGFSFPRTGN